MINTRCFDRVIIYVCASYLKICPVCGCRASIRAEIGVIDCNGRCRAVSAKSRYNRKEGSKIHGVNIHRLSCSRMDDHARSISSTGKLSYPADKKPAFLTDAGLRLCVRGGIIQRRRRSRPISPSPPSRAIDGSGTGVTTKLSTMPVQCQLVTTELVLVMRRAMLCPIRVGLLLL